MADKTITVTVATGSRYGGGTGNTFYFDASRDMSYDVVSGLTYRFVQSDPSNDGHPLVFSTAPNTTEIITSGVSYYLDGASNQADYTETTTFNAATTRYVEITPNTSSDFYDLCFIHGVAMGGVMDVQTTVWGALDWGSGFWSQQNNASSGTLTGQALTLAEGDVTAFLREGWGATNWGNGEWGDVTDSGSGSLTGLSATFTLGSPTITGVVNQGYGRSTWNSNLWGSYGTVLPTGLSATFDVGSPTITTQINTGWGRSTWGAYSWGENVTVVDVDVSGIGMSITLGTPTITAEVMNGWGRNTWGSQVWGNPNEAAAPTGIGMSFTLGTPTITGVVNTGWGRSTWGAYSWGENVTVVDVAVTGQEMTATLSEETIVTEINKGWGRYGWGKGNWGDSGTTVTLGSFSAPMALGSVDPSPDAFLTGIEMSMNMGDEETTVNARLTLTGIALTATTKAPNTLIWSEVDTGTAPTWTEVDTAA